MGILQYPLSENIQGTLRVGLGWSSYRLFVMLLPLWFVTVNLWQQLTISHLNFLDQSSHIFKNQNDCKLKSKATIEN
jgi:hypothetical protein